MNRSDLDALKAKYPVSDEVLKANPALSPMSFNPDYPDDFPASIRRDSKKAGDSPVPNKGNPASAVINNPAKLKKPRGAVMPKESEADFQKALIDLLHTYGYKVCEFRKAARLKENGSVTYRTPFGADGVGYSDLFAAHPVSGYSFYIECKSDTGKLSNEQKEWLNLLRSCGLTAFVWNPAQWDDLAEIVKELAKPGKVTERE